MDAKKYRGENWSPEEKIIFLNIMKQSVTIIECKKTDTNSNRRKLDEWTIIQKKLMKLTGKRREIPQLKGFWRRVKRTGKANILKHINGAIEGDDNKPPSPRESDQIIVKICPTFVPEEVFDSDENNKTDEDNEENDDDSLRIARTFLDQTEELTTGVDVTKGTQCDYKIKHLITQSSSESIECPRVIMPNIQDTTTMKEDIISWSLLNAKEKISPAISLQKESILNSKIELKEKSLKLLEEEHEIKMKYHRTELSHQEIRHRLELDILILEKEKKELEIAVLKKSLR